MKVSEIEVSVKYQPESYTSGGAAVRVILEEGDNIDDVAQFAAEQAAKIATAGSPNDYGECMGLLRRNVNPQALSKMRDEWQKLQDEIKDYRNKVFVDEGLLDALKTADNRQQRLQQILETANVWREFQGIITNIAEAEIHNQELAEQPKLIEADPDEF